MFTNISTPVLLILYAKTHVSIEISLKDTRVNAALVHQGRLARRGADATVSFFTHSCDRKTAAFQKHIALISCFDAVGTYIYFILKLNQIDLFSSPKRVNHIWTRLKYLRDLYRHIPVSSQAKINIAKKNTTQFR